MATDMATLTLSEITRSTRTDLVSRPRPAMASLALSAARDEVIVSGRRRGVVSALSGHPYALVAPCGPSNRLSQCGNHVDIQVDVRPAAVINQSKSIQSIDQGFDAVKHDGMGAFVTSLGSRPPSPPV